MYEGVLRQPPNLQSGIPVGEFGGCSNLTSSIVLFQQFPRVSFFVSFYIKLTLDFFNSLQCPRSALRYARQTASSLSPTFRRKATG